MRGGILRRLRLKHPLPPFLIFTFKRFRSNEYFMEKNSTLARPSLIPSLCTHSTRAGIEWRRCYHAVCMARSYDEPHHSGWAEP